MAVGDPQYACTPSSTVTYTQCGTVYLFKLELGVWIQVARIAPPVPATSAAFGTSVQIDAAYGRVNDYTIVIGAPGAVAVYVYTWDPVLYTATLVGTLKPPSDGGLNTGITPDLRFGSENTLSLADDVLAVSSPGGEALYLYYREWISVAAGFVWNVGGSGGAPNVTLVSADRDVDQLLTRTALHAQG